MSLVEIEENLYKDGPLDFGLGFGVRTPALTPDSSFTFGQQKQQQHQYSPPTPQGPVPDRSFWYSPATPLLISTPTPTSDSSDYQPNVYPHCFKWCLVLTLTNFCRLVIGRAVRIVYWAFSSSKERAPHEGPRYGFKRM